VGPVDFKTIMKTSRAAEIDSVNAPLTVQELQTLDSFEKEILRFAEHRKSSRLADVQKQIAEAFALLKTLLCEESLMMSPHSRYAQRLADLADMALARFVRTKIIPFVRPIIEKRLAAGHQSLADLVDSEKARYEEATGYAVPPNFSTAKIDAARAALGPLESMLSLDRPEHNMLPGDGALRNIFAHMRAFGSLSAVS
jgi:hypothetical protein